MAKEMSKAQMNNAIARHENADAILDELQQQEVFVLTENWRQALKCLLLMGISDPELRIIAGAIRYHEGELGQIEPREVDYAAWVAEIKRDWENH